MTSKPATPRQYAYLTTLLTERDATVTGVTDVPALIDSLRANGASTEQVSAMIKTVMGLPKAAAPATHRANNYGARCGTCGVYVQAGAGRIEKVAGKWVTYHVGACPEATAPTTQAIEPGVYVGPTGDLVRVKASKQGNLYASVGFVPEGEGKITWEYMGRDGLAMIKADWHRITADEARTIGLATHHCMFCGIELTDEREGRSVEVGYGPVCARNNGLPWG
jgi:hypothetical protein